MVVMRVLLQVLSSRRNVMNLAANVHAEAEDRNAAVDLVTGHEANSCRGAPAAEDAARVAACADGPSESNGKETDRCAHSVAVRSRQAGFKFSAGLAENWSEFLSEHEQVARDCRLSSAQILNVLHKLLRDVA